MAGAGAPIWIIEFSSGGNFGVFIFVLDIIGMYQSASCPVAVLISS